MKSMGKLFSVVAAGGQQRTACKASPSYLDKQSGEFSLANLRVRTWRSAGVRKAEPTLELRERGIYRLPDAREFIVRRSGDGAAYLLFDVRTWRAYAATADYRALRDGRVFSRGTVTRWRVADLVDTG